MSECGSNSTHHNFLKVQPSILPGESCRVDLELAFAGTLGLELQREHPFLSQDLLHDKMSNQHSLLL